MVNVEPFDFLSKRILDFYSVTNQIPFMLQRHTCKV